MSRSLEELDPNFAIALPGDDLAWYDVRALGMEGQGWGDVESPFDRLPAKAKSIVREPVWELSRQSAGLCVRFITAARQIGARWKLIAPPPPMVHMPASGHSSLDLYVRHNQRWQWRSIAMAGQSGVDQQAALNGNPDSTPREFALYLPLYNGVSEVRLGLPRDARLSQAPPRSNSARPVVFYGTSIVQGGCAARPGMAYPALLGRWLDCQTINLGFSGNGPMDLELAPLLAEIDASVYVLDCAPNMTPEMIAQRTVPFIESLRRTRKTTPIVLMENVIYQFTITDEEDLHSPKNRECRAAYDRLVDAGGGSLHYLPASHLLGDDREATVDGTHPTDVGFLRLAEAILPIIKPLVK